MGKSIDVTPGYISDGAKQNSLDLIKTGNQVRIHIHLDFIPTQVKQ